MRIIDMLGLTGHPTPDKLCQLDGRGWHEQLLVASNASMAEQVVKQSPQVLRLTRHHGCNERNAGIRCAGAWRNSQLKATQIPPLAGHHDVFPADLSRHCLGAWRCETNLRQRSVSKGA
jgi:hypothetical protein